MTTGFNSRNPTVLFIHQMIPHHQNAVNMAKSLLRREHELLHCDDILNEDDQKCIIQNLLRPDIPESERIFTFVKSSTTGTTTTTNSNTSTAITTSAL